MRPRRASLSIFLLTLLCLASSGFGATALSSSSTMVTISESGSYTASGITIEGGLWLEGAYTDTLTISDSVTITGSDSVPGIYVPEGATLVINGTGTLIAAGGEYSAGIGGAHYAYGSGTDQDIAGTLKIEDSVTVVATGGYYAAGIGGGYNSEDSSNSYHANGGSVYISGNATVTATGDSATGGTVGWTGEGCGAGIGGGDMAQAGWLTSPGTRP